MNRIIQRRSATRKRRLTRRLDKFNYPDDLTRPMLRPPTSNMSWPGERWHGLRRHRAGASVGALLGAGSRHRPALHVFKIHLPYHESDHVLNLAYNALCGGTSWKIWNCAARTRAI